jgi:phage tail sheath protein FI
MAFQLSPGVEIREFDLTSVIPAIATTPAGYVGLFQWGPADTRVLIETEKQLTDVFGKPDTSIDLATDWYVAANFLSYGGALQVVRSVGSGDDNATDASDTDGVLIKSREDFEIQFQGAYTGYSFKWAAKYPGTLGNSLKVVVIDSKDPSPNTNTGIAWETYTNTYGIPGTSDYASTINASANDEITILVIDEDGAWTGTKGTVLEQFVKVSKATDARSGDGSSNYWRSVVNGQSKYVWAGVVESTGYYSGTLTWNSAVDASNAFKVLSDVKEYSLAGGSLNTTKGVSAEADVVATFQAQFSNAEDVDVSLLIAGNLAAANAKEVVTLAANRQDCIAFVSPRAVTDVLTPVRTSDDAVYTAINNYRTTVGSSSYGVMDGNAKYQYDRYNDRFLYIPLCGDTAGCCVRTDNTREPWFSPAGYDRGRINNIVKLVWNPSKTYRDKLYKNNINPIVSFQGSGAILFGDKTLQSKPSAFDRINVRRLFNVLEKTIATAAKFQLFEFNDAFTRAQFRQLVEPFLREVQGKRGVSSYAVICDESNNTSSVIDQNQFVADIFVAPARSINFIRLNFVATPTGVTFAEFGG